jgi:hypothetical protein
LWGLRQALESREDILFLSQVAALRSRVEIMSEVIKDLASYHGCAERIHKNWPRFFERRKERPLYLNNGAAQHDANRTKDFIGQVSTPEVTE